MRVAAAFVAILLSMTLQAQGSAGPSSTANQSRTATSCGGGHTVDDYLAEKSKLRKKRSKNPLPSDTCILGWCRDTSKIPTSHPPEEVPPAPLSRPTSPSATGESSSKPKQEPVCDPYSAAQDVEVGDFYYQDKNYRAALNRYETALQSKPGDPGIFLRLGKTAEKLNDLDRAVREYQSSIDAAAEGPSGREAKVALERIKSKNAK